MKKTVPTVTKGASRKGPGKKAPRILINGVYLDLEDHTWMDELCVQNPRLNRGAVIREALKTLRKSPQAVTRLIKS